MHKSLVETKLKDTNISPTVGSEPSVNDLEVAIKNHEEVGKLLSKMKEKISQNPESSDTQGW